MERVSSDRHGDRGTLSFMCIWHLEVPSPDLYRFLWCLWTDAILRLRRGTKRGEFWKKGSLPGSDLSYGHNTGFHKIESLFLILERDSGESGLEREVPFTSACKRCKGLWRDPCLPQTWLTLGAGAPLRKWILAVSKILLSLQTLRQGGESRTGQFAGGKGEKEEKAIRGRKKGGKGEKSRNGKLLN